MDAELYWENHKAQVESAMAALLAQGISVEDAKHLSRWNPTLGYATFADMMSGSGSPTLGQRDYVTLQVARSKTRVNSGQLEGAQLDAGVLYAVFIPNIPEIFISSIAFLLDGVPVHTEFSTPWDYAGTDGGGDATRVTFVPGSYTISANIVDMNGFFSIEASFYVE